MSVSPKHKPKPRRAGISSAEVELALVVMHLRNTANKLERSIKRHLTAASKCDDVREAIVHQTMAGVVQIRAASYRQVVLDLIRHDHRKD